MLKAMKATRRAAGVFKQTLKEESDALGENLLGQEITLIPVCFDCSVMTDCVLCPVGEKMP